MLKREELPECDVATTVQIIGNKWKLLIMRNLLSRPWRFNELRKSLDGVSQMVLTDSLRQLESDGIILRTVYPDVPPRVEYSLTELGESMRPILTAMENWGRNYNLCNDTYAANTLYKSWQVPMECYSQMQIGYAELQTRLLPCGEIGRYLFEELQQVGMEND